MQYMQGSLRTIIVVIELTQVGESLSVIGILREKLVGIACTPIDLRSKELACESMSTLSLSER
jgi:hypothetical protein